MSRTVSQHDLMVKRAELLATVLMTAREDVRPAPVFPDTDAGVDQLYRVSVGKPGLRHLGVVLKAVLTRAGGDRSVRRAAESVRHAPVFPVALFYFAVQEDAAWYVWVSEPVIENGRAVLRSRASAPASLDAEAVDRIVAAADHWYDVLFSNLAGGRPVPPSRPVGPRPTDDDAPLHA